MNAQTAQTAFIGLTGPAPIVEQATTCDALRIALIDALSEAHQTAQDAWSTAQHIAVQACQGLPLAKGGEAIATEFAAIETRYGDLTGVKPHKDDPVVSKIRAYKSLLSRACAAGLPLDTTSKAMQKALSALKAGKTDKGTDDAPPKVIDGATGSDESGDAGPVELSRRLGAITGELSAYLRNNALSREDQAALRHLAALIASKIDAPAPMLAELAD